MNLLQPGERVIYIAGMGDLAGPATVVRQLVTGSPEWRALAPWNVPLYEIEWPDGHRDITSHEWLARSFSFGPTATPEQEREQP